MDNYNKLFMIIRKTDLLNYDEKDELQLYLINLKEQVKKQKEVIDKARQCIKDFLCSEEYINVDGDAIANNYENILDILKGEDKEVSEWTKKNF